MNTQQSMSAWTIALVVSSLYLMQKNMKVGPDLNALEKKYNDRSKPDEPLSSTGIRNVQRTIPAADTYQDMNIQDLPKKDVANLVAARNAAHDEVTAYEEGPPPIQGVYLVRGF